MVYVRKLKRSTKRPFKVRKKTNKALNVVEKKQVKNIAKKVVNQLAETKYFATNGSAVNLATSAAWETDQNIRSDIQVYGFTTGESAELRQNGNRTTFIYGTSNQSGDPIEMLSLKMNRIFTTSDTVVTRRQQAIEGNSIRPSYAECKWLLERPQSTVTNDTTKALPYLVRLIRCRPRATKGSFQTYDPQNDLFLDQYNEPFGINTGSKTSNPRFGRNDFHMAKTNSRRYNIIEDKCFSMLPSGIVFETTDNQGDPVDNVNSPNMNGAKLFTTKHKIGTELYYPDPNTIVATPTADFNQSPVTGFIPEFILFHILGVSNPSTSYATQADSGFSDNIRISARPISTFKDT